MTTELLLRDRLSDRDLALLARLAGESWGEAHMTRLRRRPGWIDELLASPQVFEALFGQGQRDPLLVGGPFLAFAVLLAHTPSLLQGLAFVPEWAGKNRRVPVFEVEPLRDFANDSLRRLFLTDVLASYTHVASGPVSVRSRGGWRHRRFSELDPSQFAELILMVPPGQRLPLYRRLGDLTLFLSGVFPDFVGSGMLTPIAVERLRKAVGSDGSKANWGHLGHGSALAAVGLMEWLGRRSYTLAWEGTTHRQLGFGPVLETMSEHFRYARVILNLLTDRYLFQHRERWFHSGPRA